MSQTRPKCSPNYLTLQVFFFLNLARLVSSLFQNFRNFAPRSHISHIVMHIVRGLCANFEVLTPSGNGRASPLKFRQLLSINKNYDIIKYVSADIRDECQKRIVFLTHLTFALLYTSDKKVFFSWQELHLWVPTSPFLQAENGYFEQSSDFHKMAITFLFDLQMKN